jgi:hypothetical protein
MRCNFDGLCAYVHNELSEDRKHEIMVHLHECDICLEAVILMCRDEGVNLDVVHSFESETAPFQHPNATVRGKTEIPASITRRA